ncbi:MAG TPA: hypothetical protein VE596_19630 [Gaiellaceae bacterium]|jgi:hypothetical protein|nr:hypothetical protein [Gaiellaceae bacterium]
MSTGRRSPDAGTIRLTRESRGWRDRLRAYSVVVDSEVVGKIRRGETIELSVAPGAHSVQVAIDWARSPAIDIDFAPGETVDLRCAPNTAQPALIGVTAGRGEYVRLWRDGDRVEERPRVPWLRFVTLAVLLAALAIASAAGRVVDAAIIGVLTLLSASVLAAWAYARMRR